jgi:hypothetical protein
MSRLVLDKERKKMMKQYLCGPRTEVGSIEVAVPENVKYEIGRAVGKQNAALRDKEQESE